MLHHSVRILYSVLGSMMWTPIQIISTIKLSTTGMKEKNSHLSIRVFNTVLGSMIDEDRSMTVRAVVRCTNSNVWKTIKHTSTWKLQPVSLSITSCEHLIGFEIPTNSAKSFFQVITWTKYWPCCYDVARFFPWEAKSWSRFEYLLLRSSKLHY